MQNEQITPIQQLYAINPHNWVAKHADCLYTYAITRINDAELARDLVQETFLAALEKVDKFEGRSSERTWLIAIIKNKIIDVYRKRAACVVVTTDLEKPAEGEPDFFNPDYCNWKVEQWPQEMGIEADNAVISKEFVHVLQKCMQKLPHLWLSVFTMKHMDEQATETICAELKVSPSNFWVIIHRAKVNLRACLQKNWI